VYKDESESLVPRSESWPAHAAVGGTGEGLDSPVLDVGRSGELEFWAVESEITGGPKRPPVPPVGSCYG
jgi:hypothetical protein